MRLYSSGRVIDIIGSGYDKDVLPYAWLALIAGLADFKVDIKEPVPLPRSFTEDRTLGQTKKVIEEVKKYHRVYWKSLE